MGSAVRLQRFDVAAQLLSILGSPPVLAIAIAVLAGMHAGGFARSASSILGLLLGACVLPTVFTFALFRSGRTSTLDLRERAERILPSVVTALCCTVVSVTLHALAAPETVSALAIGVAAQMLLLALITAHWKVSYHSASAAALVTVGHSLDNSGLTLALVCLAVLVGWARVYQRRHTLAEVVVGAMTVAPIALLTS